MVYRYSGHCHYLFDEGLGEVEVESVPVKHGLGQEHANDM